MKIAEATRLCERFGFTWEVRYVPQACADRLAALLQGSSVERTFQVTTEVLSQLRSCRKVPKGLDVGPCEVQLCAHQLAQQPKAALNSYVTFLDILAEGECDVSGIQFAEPSLVVRSSPIAPNTSPPDCAVDFAANLTKKIDQLLAHATKGHEFRRLKALLLLTKVFLDVRGICCLDGLPPLSAAPKPRSSQNNT